MEKQQEILIITLNGDVQYEDDLQMKKRKPKMVFRKYETRFLQAFMDINLTKLIIQPASVMVNQYISHVLLVVHIIVIIIIITVKSA